MDTEKDTNGLSYISKKTERISSAVYLISDLINENDPIKFVLRTSSLDIVRNAKGLPNCLIDEECVRNLRNVRDGLDMLSAVLKIARTARVVSEMNHRIMNEEIVALREVVDLHINTLSAGNRELPLSGKHFELGPNDFVSVKHINVTNMKSTPKTADTVTDRRPGFAERRTAVISFLSEHPMSTVKEVASSPSFLGKISEKTVQRELVSLVEQGAVKRDGERRWSRYFVADNGNS